MGAKKGPGMNTSEAATAIGTDARTLRRFLRSDPTYNNPGSSGRYNFTTRDIPVMKNRFSKWNETQKTPKVAIPKATNRKPTTNEVPIESSQVESTNNDEVYDDEAYDGVIPRSLSTVASKRENARVARLEARLLEVGLHISQHRGNR